VWLNYLIISSLISICVSKYDAFSIMSSTNTFIIKDVTVFDRSWCPTPLWFSYDTCHTAKIGVNKKNSLLRHFFGRSPTSVKHSYNTCRTSILKEFFFASTLLIHISDISTRINNVSKQQSTSMGIKNFTILL
jgi:hypothetical protein